RAWTSIRTTASNVSPPSLLTTDDAITPRNFSCCARSKLDMKRALAAMILLAACKGRLPSAPAPALAPIAAPADDELLVATPWPDDASLATTPLTRFGGEIERWAQAHGQDAEESVHHASNP